MKIIVILTIITVTNLTKTNKMSLIIDISKKNKGFDVVKSLTEHFKEMYFYIDGGSAGYLHALNERNVEIELNDIDVIVTNNDNTLNINNKIINYITDNYENVKVYENEKVNCEFDKKLTIYYVDIGNDIRLNFFINEIDELPNNIIKIFEVNVSTFEDVLKKETKMLNVFTEELIYCSENNFDISEMIYFQDKIHRKKEFINLFNLSCFKL